MLWGCFGDLELILKTHFGISLKKQQTTLWGKFASEAVSGAEAVGVMACVGCVIFSFSLGGIGGMLWPPCYCASLGKNKTEDDA